MTWFWMPEDTWSTCWDIPMKQLPYPVCLGHGRSAYRVCIYMPETSFALGANEWIMGHMSWNRVTEKILFTGISGPEVTISMQVI